MKKQFSAIFAVTAVVRCNHSICS